MLASLLLLSKLIPSHPLLPISRHKELPPIPRHRVRVHVLDAPRHETNPGQVQQEHVRLLVVNQPVQFVPDLHALGFVHRAPAALDQLLHPTLDPKAPKELLARGLPASPGAASGEVVFSADEAERLAQEGRKVILVRVETSPEDIHGMHAAVAIVTARGGMTSHAAVVARGMGKCCVAGCSALHVDYAKQQLVIQMLDGVLASASR